MTKVIYILIALQLLASCTATLNEAPNQLTVSEGFKNPIGFYDQTPTFSWKLPVLKQVKFQSGYQIVVASDPELLPHHADLWDSKAVPSDQSVRVTYRGKPLQSKQKVYWQVRFTDQEGHASAWSEVANFELGLLSNADWTAKWISLEPEVIHDTLHASTLLYTPQYLRKSFLVDHEIAQARLFITAKGLFEAQINGKKVGEDVMVPGWTPYTKRIETLSYDVTDLLNEDQNTIGIILGSGWHSGRLGWSKFIWFEKPLPRALCQLEITYKNGDKAIIPTDSEWKGTRNGPIRSSSIYDGEVYDARLEFPHWSTFDFDDSQWENVIAEALDPNVDLVPKSHLAVTPKSALKPIAITHPDSGRYVFDLGQNMVGVMDLKIPVKKDQTVTVRFAEMLNPDGTLYTENYRNAKSTDYYIPKEDGTISYRPTFTFHGFRYVELSGFDEDQHPEKDWVTGIVQYSNFDKTGHFNASHDKLNQLQQNITWGLRGNLLDIPTDCPQRDERLGWTGDAQVILPTSMFNYSLHAFWSSWLKSAREEQGDDGSIPFVIPNCLGPESSSGWADAVTVIPWELYFRTGDTRILEDNYEMMKGLVAYYKAHAENHIADVNTFGDWLQPYPLGEGNRGDTPQDLIGTAYFARSTDLTLRAAQVLGKLEDVRELRTLRDTVRAAFEDQFIDSEGKLTTEFETQTGYLMALGFELVTEETAQKILPHLIRKIEDADHHLRTGFLGTPLLPTVLDKYGLTDIMYTILFKETYPSWFYCINQGATTMWERWNSYSHEDGFGDAGMNSFNHYAYGAIGQWLYERIAGLAPLEPGYKKVRIAPIPGGPLSFAEASYESIYGRVSSAWRKVDSGLELHVTVAPNTAAQIRIPIKDGMAIRVDGEELSERSDITFVKRTETAIELEAMPGTYVFKTL
ncbi:family 78 glycoside hydrolase catalytic domain [Aestuariivivens sediminis]|uniref:family 78 glycoside hydrolase catalytic domain n=1 Tax=Aestuariivivens sediminis TaxID=2913557 RepID=UPI001F5AF47D|nr:family 78 glycoside hydrolase catalytic domain [Aestuariivivens sediminis]